MNNILLCVLSKTIFRLLHISQNGPCLPRKILQKDCFQFLLGQLLYPGEMKNKSYATFGVVGGGGGRQTRCVIGDAQMESRLWCVLLIAELHPRAKRSRGRSSIAKEMW